ncbi:hypothetical protein ACH4TX_08310 [Streptomyces sp. NPDC021098]|uniref:hypothetical protein n=1 Tax=unclassified Streptomyces TaxID=2593676 RepID=UPI0037AC9154
MTEAPTRLFWLSRPDAEAPPPHWQPLHDGVYWERLSRGPDRRQLFAPAPDWADDLQRVGRAAFAADRYARRAESFDHWTRRITLSVPVAHPERWDRALPALTAVLGTVTGDLWEVVFRPLHERSVREAPLTFLAEEYAHEVALFSGGLDSLGWAAQRAGQPSGLPSPLPAPYCSSASRSGTSRHFRITCTRRCAV